MPLNAKDNLDTVLAATIGPMRGPRIGEAIDALVKERILQAFMGTTQSAPDDARAKLHANILKAWGDAT